MPSLVPPYTDDTIRRMAEECLRENHPDGSIPIPIEDIIDIRFRIDIVPYNDLRANYDIDGYVSQDGSSIYVDSDVYRNRPTRLRFTLAHELAHLRLHPRVFASAQYTTVGGWIEFIQSMPDSAIQKLESQARIMAGYLLVPRSSLQVEYEQMSSLLDQSGFDITNMSEAVFTRVARVLGERFGVSSSVIARQGAREGLWAWEAIPENW